MCFGEPRTCLVRKESFITPEKVPCEKERVKRIKDEEEVRSRIYSERDLSERPTGVGVVPDDRGTQGCHGT